jgi:putative transposase
MVAEQIDRWGQELIGLEVMPDHVPLLVGCDPPVGVHRLIKLLKGSSSHALREEFPTLKRRLPSLRTNRYFVATKELSRHTLAGVELGEIDCLPGD